MKHDSLTWTAGNRDIPRNPPGGRSVHSVRQGNGGTCLPDSVRAPANGFRAVPCMQAVESVVVRAAAPCTAAVAVALAVVPVFAEVVAAATWSVAVVLSVPVARRVLVRPSVSAAVEDIAVQVAVVVALQQPVVPAVPLPRPSGRTGCPCSSPLSVPPPFRQSSSGPAAWHRGVPVRARRWHPCGSWRQSVPPPS